MTKKILLIYPHHPFHDTDGINARQRSLLKYFENRDIGIDILTFSGFKSDNTLRSEMGKNVRGEVFVFDFKKAERRQPFKNRKSNPMNWIRRKIPFLATHRHLPDFAWPSLQRFFKDIITHHRYDFVIISYIYWANLVESVQNQPGGLQTVLDLSDFLTLNIADRCNGAIKTGALLEDEIRRVNLFHHVMCISEDERFFFSRFARRPQFHFIPHFMDEPNDRDNGREIKSRDFNTDLLFIGSDNPHNITGLKWFLEKVFLLLPPSTRIQIAGTVCRHVKPDLQTFSRVTFRGVVDDLNALYHGSKVVICPLLGGTGMKIKVVEALAHHKPVVCTSRGIDGFPYKIYTGCWIADTPNEFADAIQRLLKNYTLYHLTSETAALYFQEHFSRKNIERRLDRIFLGK